VSKLTLFFLGPPRLLRNGVSLEPDTRKAVALLAYLAVTGQAHTRDTLATLLYAEYDESHARGALRRTLSSLNKALSDEGLVIARDRIALSESADIEVDTRRFEDLLVQVDRHVHMALETCPECQSKLEESVGLYRGDFLAGFSLRDSAEFDDWKFFQGESLRRRFSSALERLARGYRLRNHTDQAIETARRWLALDPLQEDAHRELMRSYAQAGQRNAALRQFNECARILEKELGVEPMEETRELQRAILEFRYHAPAPAEPPGTDPTPAAATPEITVQASTLTESREFPLIGRQQSWATLLDAYQNHAARGYFFALEGEPGIGKTRLAEELLAFAARQGSVTLSTRCFEGESSLAYAPIIELLRGALNGPTAMRLESLSKDWLSESARLLADMRQRFPDLPNPPPLSSPGAQSVFFEGLRQTLFCLTAGHPPGIIFFDDVHWADSVSLDLLAYLIRRLAGQAVLLLVAWREGDLPAQTRLHALLAENQRAGQAGGMRLERLKEADVVELARFVGPQPVTLPVHFTSKLFQESEGLPLVIVEYLDAFRAQLPGDRTAAAFPAGETGWQVPDNTRELFMRRLSALDDISRQMLTAAAVIGRSFDFETLATVVNRSEAETIGGLETLVSHGIVQECGLCDQPGEIRYDFTHEKLRSLVYAETSQIRRRLLHGQVGNVLAEMASRRSPSSIQAGQIAQHYRLAGNVSAAAVYYRIAADDARRLYANRQALELYQAALSLQTEPEFEIYTHIGDLQTLLGEYDAALETYQEAFGLSPDKDKGQLAHQIGNVYLRRGEWQAAIAQYQAALDAAPPDGLAARCLADWSLAVMQMGALDEAEQLAQQARERAGSGGPTLALAQAHNLLGMLLRRRKQYDAAHDHLEQSLQLGISLEDESIQTAALNNLALLYEERGDLPTALIYTQKALALCEKLGDRHRAAALHNHLADLYQHTGYRGLAMEHLKQAVVVFAEIGGIDQIQPEIWRLTEW
jgi:DNA-binding SARP family transcriptional activator/lipoprotein NlpI